jgi:hypothetical protein
MKTLLKFLPCAMLSVSSVSLSVADELSTDSANTMTCGTNFISVGDTEDAVLNTCGEPSFREGNRWTYSNVQGSFVYELTFGGGNVLSIHTRAGD